MKDLPNPSKQELSGHKIDLFVEYGIGSFWGAIASFLWLQLFAFAMFHIAFLFIDAIDFAKPATVITPFFVLFIVYQFIKLQSRVFYSLKGYFSEHKGSYLPSGFKDILKILFSILLLSILVLLFLGYFPIREIPTLQSIPLYALSWIASYLNKKPGFFIPMSTFSNKLAFLLSGIFLVFMSIMYFGGLGLFTTPDLGVPDERMLYSGAYSLLIALGVLTFPVVSILFDE